MVPSLVGASSAIIALSLALILPNRSNIVLLLVLEFTVSACCIECNLLPAENNIVINLTLRVCACFSSAGTVAVVVVVVLGSIGCQSNIFVARSPVMSFTILYDQRKLIDRFASILSYSIMMHRWKNVFKGFFNWLLLMTIWYT
jgi:hypothetical protein